MLESVSEIVLIVFESVTEMMGVVLTFTAFFAGLVEVTHEVAVEELAARRSSVSNMEALRTIVY